MASSPFRSKTRFHARSVSLPSTSHPLNPQFDEHLCRVRATEEASSSSLSSISKRLNGLEYLYDCVDDLLLLPHTQQAFFQERHEKWVGEALEGHLTLLDVCATAKDVLSQKKQNVQQLLSILRRRRDANDFGGYLTSRTKEKKVIQKSVKDLKNIKNKRTLLAMDKDHESVPIVSMLNEVEAVTLAVFESLLSYIAGTKVQSRPSGWSLVSKLMHHKSVSFQDEETDTNKFDKIDAALHSLFGHKTSISQNKKHVEDMQKQLGNLESSIQDLEEGLESLFRLLIKTRVSLLNILNH